MTRFPLAISALAAFAVGCAGANATNPVAPGTPSLVRDSRGSWMSPQAKSSKSILIYAAVAESKDINVYDYDSGDLVGTLTGYVADAGCADAKGNVYIASGDGDVYEYAHGGTTPLNTYAPGGELVGCSVDAKGDLAVTATTPGILTVYKHGDPSSSQTYSNSECEVLAAMGYDNKHDIIGAGEYDTVGICAVLAGTRQMATLSTSGIKIKFPNGAMWDGKYIEVSDAEAGTGGQTGLIQATLSGTTLTSVGETVLEDNCYRGLVDVPNPFVVGAKNTPVNNRQGKVVVGSNLYCETYPTLEYWHYPTGGTAFKSYSLTQRIVVLAVSIGT